MTVYTFENRKTEIRKIMLDLLACIIFIFLIITAVLLTAFLAVESVRQRVIILSVVIPVFSLIDVALLLSFIGKFKIYKIIKTVDTTRTEELVINCKNVGIISYPSGRTGRKILGITLTDECGQKYVSLFLLDYAYSDKENIKDKLTGEIQVLRYCNSCVIADAEKLLKL